MSGRLSTLLFALLPLLAARTAQAQDPVKVSPDHFTVLLENERVRVLDFHTKAGEKIPTHSHPAYISYSISGHGCRSGRGRGGGRCRPIARSP